MNPSSTFNSDVHKFVISNTDIEKNLSNILGDSIITNNNFEIINISDSILNLLNYDSEELVGESINKISNIDIKSPIQIDLVNGFFKEKEYEIKTKKGHGLIVGISGFYLGLISDMNGLIVLKIRNLNEIKRIYEQLEYKTMELDQFLYRSAHDLRGPIATIKGLTYVAKMEEADPQRNYYFNEILKFAEKLDDSLKSIQQIANSDTNEFENLGLVNFDKVENILNSIVANYQHPKIIDFKLNVHKVKYDFNFNETYTLSLLKNLILFTLELEKDEGQQRIDVDFTTLNNNIEINISQSGFIITKELSEKLNRDYLSCVDVLKESSLVRYYAAEKIAHKLKGRLGIVIHSENKFNTIVSIPINV